jgi:hypothetical protein
VMRSFDHLWQRHGVAANLGDIHGDGVWCRARTAKPPDAGSSAPVQPVPVAAICRVAESAHLKLMARPTGS